MIAASTVALLAQEAELPQREEGEPPLEIEPPLLVPLRAPDGSIPDLPGTIAAAPGADIAKLEKDLARAQKRAAGADRLYKAGIIAKVDAERRALKVIQLEAEIAGARLAEAKANAETAGSPETEDAVAKAATEAKRAAEERHRAEIDAALRNLQRQRKLLALGSGRRADVNRAEQKLSELQRAEE